MSIEGKMEAIGPVSGLVSRWYPRAETALYRGIAAIAARVLGRLDFVLAVYARRSVACGEVVLARSDVDLHVIVTPFDDPAAEGRAMAALARRLDRLRRLLPILGDFDASTPRDLERWYRNRPGYWYRDRGWLRLWGESIDRPTPDPADPLFCDSLVRWFILTVDRLPALLRLGSKHHCTNLVADLIDAHDLIRGGSDRARRRGEVLESWWRADPADGRRERLARGYASAFRRGGGEVLSVVEDVVMLCLELGDAVAAAVGVAVPDRPAEFEILARPPFGFTDRRHLLPDPRERDQVARAVGELMRDPRVVVTSPGLLALRLRHWVPWEWASLARASRWFAGFEPRAEDYLRVVLGSLHPEFARATGFRGALGADFGLRLAQARLYLEEGRVAVLRDGLDRVYHAIYGRGPGIPAGSIDEYFAGDYPASVRWIRALATDPRLA